MIVKESNDHRVYMAEYGIPTIQLGCGGVIISDLKFEGENLSGIGFSLGQGDVGESHDKLKGKMAADIGVFFQIITSNPESLQVLIDKLTLAKEDLENKTQLEPKPC